MNAPHLLPDRTRLICRILKWASLVVAVLIAVIFVAGDASTNIINAVWNNLQPDIREAVTYTATKKGVLHGLAGASYFSILLIIFGAARVFSVFQKGTVFSSAAVKAVRALGLMIVLFAAIQLALPTLMVLALTYDNDEGLRAISVSVGSSQVTLLMIGAVILVIGQILTQAVAIAEENEQII
ncbi:DUF2975 domain-containing protein [Hyphomonas johnsonii]|jgi:hypothetical protein|uniref:DUF2975 domain-containing protein n=1 Tax=Hyphomonas johnsonii MHS-2 TaxID=1280950 RepID=A0A059FIY8_9PROT|nr:DUF2975 domain-containing protein [Hyphomonas johnsonii]KCZ90625.1 hypothetical protein HJO_12276 [Hyphomonas johnsonii MHS-2]